MLANYALDGEYYAGWFYFVSLSEWFSMYFMGCFSAIFYRACQLQIVTLNGIVFKVMISNSNCYPQDKIMNFDTLHLKVWFFRIRHQRWKYLQKFISPYIDNFSVKWHPESLNWTKSGLFSSQCPPPLLYELIFWKRILHRPKVVR